MARSPQIIGILTILAIACDRPGSDENAHTGKATLTASAPPSGRAIRSKEIAADARQSVAEGDFSGGPVATSVPAVPSQPDAATPSLLIRTGDAMLEVSKVDPAIVKVRELAGRVGGYITNTSTTGGRDQVRAAMLELRVPAARYDETLAGLAGIGRVEATQTNAQDVGEEFVDITARVDNARKLEARLADLLSKRTGKLEEVLAVERELARVRTEIDQMEGRLRYLKNRVALSTLTVNLHEPQPLIGNTPGENPIAAAIRQAWRNFVGFIASLIASLGVLIPLAALGLIGWMVFRRVRAGRGKQS